MKPIYFYVLLAMLLTSCGGTKYEFWDLSNFKMKDDALENNEEIKLLYSSRGPGNNEDIDYYIHLIVISQKTGDTVNVLTTANNGFKTTDKDKVFNFFDKNNAATKIMQLKSSDIKSIEDLKGLDEMKLKKIDKVARDPKFDNLANNDYPTVIGSIGTFTPATQDL